MQGCLNNCDLYIPKQDTPASRPTRPADIPLAFLWETFAGLKLRDLLSKEPVGTIKFKTKQMAWKSRFHAICFVLAPITFPKLPGHPAQNRRINKRRYTKIPSDVTIIPLNVIFTKFSPLPLYSIISLNKANV